MDFFNRLIRRASTTTAPPQKAASKTNTPQHRLNQFKAVYSSLLRLWRNGQGVSRDAFVAENVRVHVYRLAQILNADIRGPTPHLVVSFAFTNGVLRTLVQVATAFAEAGITSESLSVLQLVVDNEEEAFLEDRGLADAFPPFVEVVKVDVLGRQWGDKEEEVEKFRDREVGLESRLAEVLFGIASAVRNKHLVLKAWFRPEQVYADEDELTEEDAQTRMEDFPLFYMLMEDISSKGRVGDFARMGLLYIVEATSYSSRLERWLIEGDLAVLMASNLGALYSQLSRKLIMAHIDGDEPPLCKYGTNKPITHAPFDVDVMGSANYQENMRTLLASISFWQDMLNHSPFDNIRKTLLDHFQFLFLQQLLYPSLLESSDVDGGSSVAVVTYLRNILQEVDHPDLVNRILCYLFGLPIKEEDSSEPTSSATRARRRKSEVLFSRKVEDEDKPSPELFNLSDLINNGLKSRSQPTVTVTLRLLSTLLRRQHQQALPHLLKTRHVRSSDLPRSLGGHLKEVDTWINLAANLTSFQEIEESYKAAVFDNQSTLEVHPCTYQVKRIHVPGAKENFYAIPLDPYVIVPEDPISRSLVALLDSFLTNDIETNLDLTKVILDIVSCGRMRLEGWLLTNPARYVYRKPDGTPQTPKVERPEEDQEAEEEEENAIEEEENENTISLPPAREEPAWHSDDRSPIFKSLDGIVSKVESFHRQLQDFEGLLAECRSQITSTEVKPKHGIEMESRLSKDQTHLAPTETPTKPGLSTPVRGHSRKTSLADRVASALGTSPRQNESAESATPVGPTLASRLNMRLSEASGLRPRSSGRPNPTSSGHDGLISARGKGSKEKSSAETPVRPLHARHRSLRGEDLLASPSPRLNRRVVPGTGQEEDDGSSLKRAIGNESEDEDEDDDEDEEDNLSGGSDQDSRNIMKANGENRVDQSSDSDSSRKQGEDSDGDDGESINGTDGLPTRDVTVGHLLTNIIILQEFLLEIAAMISVRGTMFGEVRFK